MTKHWIWTIWIPTLSSVCPCDLLIVIANASLTGNCFLFSPIQGLWTRSVRPSVEKHDNSLQIQHIDLKLSTHLNKALTWAKFEDGQNRTKKFSCHWYLIETKVGSMGQKINFVRMSWNLVHLHFGSLKMISEKTIEIGWKIKKLWGFEIWKWL